MIFGVRYRNIVLLFHVKVHENFSGNQEEEEKQRVEIKRYSVSWTT